jgi:hypothetical protein
MSRSPLTNFPNGVTSFGVPVFGGYLPTQGNTYFVKAYSGNDANSGLSPQYTAANSTRVVALGFNGLATGHLIGISQGISQS